MLDTIGVSDVNELFSSIPAGMMLDKLDLEPGKSELEVRRVMESLAGKNHVFSSVFRGAGSYNHYIPSIVGIVTGKEEFRTAYTPYQAEISQGILQSIFEYQTMIARLTGMDVSNASVYDGASAAAEAVAMCVDRRRRRALVSATTNPMVVDVIKTYCYGSGVEVVMIPEKEGVTDTAALKALLDDASACVYTAQPNYYGQIEDVSAICQAAHAAGAKYIMGVYPIAAAVLATPGEIGADVAVGEGQPLGMPMAFGGPYLGFMAATAANMRKLPGRIVGETTDAAGNRAFVLTLQAREQHIRREKASSNICSNEALCAFTAAVYMAAMGDKGMRQVAELCYDKAHYLAEKLEEIGYTRRYGGPFFNEFVTESPLGPEKVCGALEAQDILGGMPVEGGILWCATEMNSKDQIDRLIDVLKEVH